MDVFSFWPHSSPLALTTRTWRPEDEAWPPRPHGRRFKTGTGTAHPGPDLHQTAVEDQPETVLGKRRHQHELWFAWLWSDSVESALPLSMTNPRYRVLVLEINPPDPTPLHRHQNLSLPCESTPELHSLGKRGDLGDPRRCADGARAVF